jgi:flagellin
MSLNSVNTNIGAMVALQSLNRTGSELAEVQKRISTGFRVADARDDGGAFAVAERVRSDIAANTAANQQLGGVKGLLDVGRAGLQNVSNTLKDIRTTVLRLADANVTEPARAQYMTTLKQQVLAVKNFITDAKYNGQTVLGTAAGAGPQIKTVRNGDGAVYSFAGIGAQDDIIASLAALTALAGAGTFAAQATAGGSVSGVTNRTATAMNNLGSYSRYVDAQINFNKSIIDAQESGLGALIDADLAKESARLQALQIRQQLGSQALGIANQAPQVLLSLFR